MITKVEEKRLLDLYRSLIYYYLDNGKRDMTLEDRPYINFVSCIHEYVSTSEYYDSSLMEMVIDKHLAEINDVPIKVEISTIKSLIEKIFRTFEINVGEHYLVIPIPKAGLSKLIQFEKYSFIQRNLSRIEKLEVFCRITGISVDELEADFKHTEESRSPDFLKHNHLIVKVDNQTSYITYNAERIAKYCIYFLRTIYFSEIHKITESTFSIFRSAYDYRENSHLAVIAQEGWRKFHAPLWFETECDFDLDFMGEYKYQEMFRKFLDAFLFNNDIDDLALTFLNAIILFNRSYEQKLSNDDSLKLLLLITAGESLLTQNKNEKKLRLTALLSRLVKLDVCKPHEIANIVKDLYFKRNDFVHAGKKVYLPYKAEGEGLNELRVLRHVIAKILVNYIEIYDLELKADKNKSRYNKWIEYLDDIFDKIITGESSI